MWFVPENWSGEPNQSDHNRVNNVPIQVKSTYIRI